MLYEVITGQSISEGYWCMCQTAGIDDNPMNPAYARIMDFVDERSFMVWLEETEPNIHLHSLIHQTEMDILQGFKTIDPLFSLPQQIEIGTL